MDRNKQAAEILESLRVEWERARDLATLRCAVSWCRSHPVPDWLADALQMHLDDAVTSPRERQQHSFRDARFRMVLAVRVAFYGDKPFPVFYALPDETPSETHFRTASERLEKEGHIAAPASVKKAWQRHKPLTREEMLALILE